MGRKSRAGVYWRHTFAKGEKVPELFIVELPQDEAGWKVAGDAPLSGTETTLPAPPRGVVQRRLTFTHHRASPGLVNVPRHWGAL